MYQKSNKFCQLFIVSTNNPTLCKFETNFKNRLTIKSELIIFKFTSRGGAVR